MKYPKAICALGILVVIVPFSGLPHTWQTILLAVLGGSIAYFGYHLLPTRKHSADVPKGHVTPAQKHSQEKENEEISEKHE